ncbi:hypothetical protein KR054_000126 [Drosophila jambulina]|nr:hypothetical protein KR054_000126 [Drosophila jambulina]
MGNFVGSKNIEIASVLATPIDEHQLLMSQYEWALRNLFKFPIGAEILELQYDALSFLVLRAECLAQRRNLFRPLAKETIKYCLLALGHQTCQVRINIYNLMGTLAQVLGDEMVKLYPIIREQMEKDIARPHCTFIEATIIATLGTFAKDTGSAFREHLQRAFQLACVSIHNPDEDVRIDSAVALSRFVLAFHDLGCTAEVHRAYRTLVPTFASLLRKDTRQRVVVALGAALIRIYSKGVPSHSLSDRNVEAPIFECIRDLMAQKTASQRGLGQHLYDIVMLGTDLLVCYGKALHPDLYASTFDGLHRYFVQYLKENGAGFYKMIDACRETTDFRVTYFCDFLLSVLLGAIAKPNLDLRIKAYFAIGELFFQAGKAAVSFYPDILEDLLKAFGREQSATARDHVAGALARMIVANLNAVPLDKVLPTLMSSLPITEDFSVNDYVLEAFQMLYDNARDSVRDYMEPMLLISISMLKERKVHPRYMEAGTAFVKSILQTYPDKSAGRVSS